MIDLTKVINEELDVYPGDPKVDLKPIKTLKRDGYNDYLLKINMHSGTHIDGINHMKESALISAIPLDSFVGVGKVVGKMFNYAGEEVLVVPEAYLTKTFIQGIVKYPLKYIIISKNSVDEDPYPLHHLLFNNNIMIVENAHNIEKLREDITYRFYAIPLKIDADSSPIRLFAEVIK